MATINPEMPFAVDADLPARQSLSNARGSALGCDDWLTHLQIRLSKLQRQERTNTRLNPPARLSIKSSDKPLYLPWESQLRLVPNNKIR